MNTKQTKQYARLTAGIPIVFTAQIGNGIDQVLSGEWSTARLKELKCWQALPEANRVELSRLVDIWPYEASGGKGCISETGLKSYYKNEHSLSTPIMPAKFVV